MLLKRLLLVLAVVTLVGAFNAWAQHTYHGYWGNTITVSDDIGSPTQSLVFANDSNATYGMDTVSDKDGLMEIGGIPPAPSGLDVRWVSIPGRTAAAYVEVDHYHFDVRAWPTNAMLKDTFKIKVVDDPGANLTFRWNHTDIAEHCDSAVFFYRYFDGDGNPHSQDINMAVGGTGDSAVVTANDLANGFTAVTIYRWGLKGTNAVREIPQPTKPSSYALHQNYPNPFNPTTTLRFDVQKAGAVEIAVYNLLGQRVSTLVAQRLQPGSFSVTWNALDAANRPVPSGVYFARMIARGTDGVEQFSALRKLMLMK